MSSYLLPAPLRRKLRRAMDGFHDQRPASRLIRHTAREQWKLIALNVVTNFGQALTEGATLGVIYLTVEWLGQMSHGGSINWASNPLLAGLPAVAAVMASLPPMLLFVGLMVLALLLQIAQSLAAYISRISIQYFSARCVALVTARIHQQVLALTFRCASAYRVGDLSDYVEQSPTAVALQIDLLNQVLVALLMVVMYLAILLRISPWLMLAALVLGGCLALFQKKLLPLIRQEADRLVQIEVGVKSRIIEDIQGLRLLHSSGQLDNASIRLRGSLRDIELSKRRRARLIELIEPLSRLMPVVAFAVIACLSLVIFKGRSVAVLPNLVTFMLALQRLNSRLAGIAVCMNLLSDNNGRINRLNAILETRDKELRRLGGVPFHNLERQIHFDHVALRYKDDLPAALQDITFTIPRGATIALVGGSGAGKSSIADLLVGLYAPTSGRILIDGNNLAEIDLSSWQQHLGVVSQDTFLFNASIADNIAFGCPWASRDDVEAAAASAQAAGFIADLPQGYDTKVGERGYLLSGGQRQRLSLARAILRKPDLLILDEATSALDSHSERLVQEAIESFEDGPTKLVIAHRLSTVRQADEILVLDHGRIDERGTHNQLVSLGGRYSKLWQEQSQAQSNRTPQPA